MTKPASYIFNQPIDPADAIYDVGFKTPWGGETLFLDSGKLAEYNRDPDLFAARHFGFATARDYREWVVSDGAARCSERTRSGRLCRASISRSQLQPPDWREQHRSRPCRIHAGTQP